MTIKRNKAFWIAVAALVLSVGGGAWIYAQTNKPTVLMFTYGRDGVNYIYRYNINGA